MPVRRLFALSAFCVFAVSGCQTTGTPIGGQTELSPEERRLQAIEDAVAELGRRMDGSQSASSDLIRLQDEVRGLRGDVEKLRYDVDSHDRNSRQLFADLDQRVAALEGTSPPVVGTAGNGAIPGTLTANTADRPKVASPEEEAAYLNTFDQLKNGKYDEAIRGFRGMLDKWPQGRYADNAWYWMGESYYVKRDYNASLSSFQSLIEKFPSSPKLADGLYKMGLCQIELGRKDQARSALQRIVNDFPRTNAANLARQKLQQLGG